MGSLFLGFCAAHLIAVFISSLWRGALTVTSYCISSFSVLHRNPSVNEGLKKRPGVQMALILFFCMYNSWHGMHKLSTVQCGPCTVAVAFFVGLDTVVSSSDVSSSVRGLLSGRFTGAGDATLISARHDRWPMSDSTPLYTDSITDLVIVPHPERES